MIKVRLVRSRRSGAVVPRGGRIARRGRGILHRDADARRHLRVRRRNPQIRGAGRGRGLCLARRRDRPESAGLRRRQISALDLSRRARARAAGEAATPGARCRSRCANGSRSSNGARCCRSAGDLLVETFPRAAKYYLVCYPFEGRLAHQTLGMLLTRRLERARLRPLGFVANEYALAVWGLGDVACASRAAISRSRNCSTRTCWATIWRLGSPNRR